LWNCHSDCHALGGTWPNYNPDHPAIAPCKLGCAPRCPPPTPPTPPPPELCLDKNKPNDPQYCQKALGSFTDKLTKCKLSNHFMICAQTCDRCPSAPPPESPPPSPSTPPPPPPSPPPLPPLPEGTPKWILELDAAGFRQVLQTAVCGTPATAFGPTRPE